MQEPKISVIIPVYNGEKYLERCIKSVLNQNYNNLEIVLIDDGSNDKSQLICDEFAEEDIRIKAFHKSNAGVSSARNLGLEKCTGEYKLLLIQMIIYQLIRIFIKRLCTYYYLMTQIL